MKNLDLKSIYLTSLGVAIAFFSGIFPSQSTSCSRSVTDRTFCIKPTHPIPNESAARTRDDIEIEGQDCITLDNFTINELPNLESPLNVTLIFLRGTHRSPQPIEFDEVQQLIIQGDEDPASQPLESLPLIYLSGDVHVSSTDDQEMPLCLKLKYLSIDGRGNHSFVVNAKIDVSRGVGNHEISVSHVNMSNIAFQIVSPPILFNCPLVNISHSKFSASIVEIKNCMFNGRTDIIQSDFLINDKYPYTIAICTSPDPNNITHPNEHSVFSTVDNGSTPKQLNLHGVRLLDFTGGNALIATVSNHLKCYNPSEDHRNSIDVYILPSLPGMLLTVTNSSFNRSNGGTAIHPKCENVNVTVIISKTNFTGYTTGVFILDTSVTYAAITFTDSLIANNNISVVGATAAGLTIAPANNQFLSNENLNIELVRCTFQQNIDNVGNLQIINLHGVYSININGTKFIENQGTVIESKEGNITFTNHVVFEGNSGWQGGALSLIGTTMTMNDHTRVDFINNNATDFGGAIYIEDPLFYLQNANNTLRSCFYQCSHMNYSFKNTTVNFLGNFAGKGGSNVYGTSIRNYCKVKYPGSYAADWKKLFHFNESNQTYSSISSKMMRICLCKGGEPQCTNDSFIFSKYNRTVYPGETFSVSVVAVGAEFGATVGDVYAKLLPLNTSSLGTLQSSFHHLNNIHCTSVIYSINSSNSHEVLYLTPTNITLKYYVDTAQMTSAIQNYNSKSVVPYTLLTAPVFINITLKKCPAGFTMIKNRSYCGCYQELLRNDITCNFREGKGYVYRDGSHWVGVQKNKTDGVIFNALCPSDQCNHTLIALDLEESDGSDQHIQCAYNHAGKLCGGCKDGYSVAIGSSHCLRCTINNNLSLLLFFIVAGPLLYMFIAAFDLTIAKGHINGLILYANVIWVYQTIVFVSSSDDSQTTQSFITALKIFVAWLNLDFGIETCFIKGLDAFWKSILQYIFPLYLWLIAWLVKLVYVRISVQHFQLRHPLIARMTGKPVDVLTTFIFLSYTKLARTVVAGLSWATLYYYPQNQTEIVWAIDGNVAYFHNKHIAVLIMAFLSFLVTLSYTIYILYVGLQSCTCMPQTRCTESIAGMRWCTSLLDMPLPLRDSHFLPLMDIHRYWLGLLLLIRVSLLIIFSLTRMIYPQSNLLILMITATVLLIYMGWKKIYKLELVWMLQAISLGNLIFLSGGILYSKKVVIVCISIAIALIQFIFVIGYQLIRLCANKESTAIQPVSVVQNDDRNYSGTSQSREETHQQSESNSFREPLLSNDDEREPLIRKNLPKNQNMFRCFNCCKEQQ